MTPAGVLFIGDSKTRRRVYDEWSS